jgi:hypothetical protein
LSFFVSVGVCRRGSSAHEGVIGCGRRGVAGGALGGGPAAASEPRSRFFSLSLSFSPIKNSLSVRLHARASARPGPPFGQQPLQHKGPDELVRPGGVG